MAAITIHSEFIAQEEEICHYFHIFPLYLPWSNGAGQTILGGSKITADGDCSHEIKRRVLLRRKVMTNLDSILKAETLLCQQRSIW